MDGRLFARIIFLAVATMLLAAAILKAFDPYEARAALSLVLAQHIGGSDRVRASANAGLFALVLTEASVGLLLISRWRPRGVSAVFAALMVVFSAFLVVLLRLPETPSCGCLGQWPTSILDARDTARLGVARNLALAVAVLWSAPRIGRGPLGPIGESAPRARVGPSGFTLVETLACIAIVGVLLAILLPALSHARKNARSVGRLGELRDASAAVALYTQDSADRFPTAVAPESPRNADPQVTGPTIEPGSYLTRNAMNWGQPLRDAGHVLVGDARACPMMMTTAAFAHPDIFQDNRVPARRDLITQRSRSVRYPSAKGLLLSLHPEVWPPAPDSGGRVFCSLVDGSASSAIADPSAAPAPGSLVYGPAFPTVWTRRGVLGQDF